MRNTFDIKNVVHTFLIIFCILLIFSMSLKNQNGVVSYYDLILCCTTYAYITIYLVIPYIFISRYKNVFNNNYLIRFKSIDRIWLSGCKKIVYWSLEVVAYVFISLRIISFIVADSFCNWKDDDGIFVSYTQYTLKIIPTIKEILIPAIIIVFLNVLLIEFIVYISYWYTGYYWMGYVLVIVVEFLPSLPIVDIEMQGLGLFYSDYCSDINIFYILMKRVCILILQVVILFLAGLLRKKKDFCL